jgi:hypothetical protein
MKIQTNAALMLAAVITAIASSSFAQLAIPSDGSDGALNLTSGTNLIDLRLAVTGNWTNSNSANAGKGIYDPTQWAVVFKYSSVNIASNAYVIFTNHPTHAPVVWLVSGNVTNNGDVNLDGGAPSNIDPLNLPEPGPGGFRGGARAQTGLGYGCGFGPGGGSLNDSGSYSTYHPYGNPQILPLIGGSGGGSYNGCIAFGVNGSSGGGAILIAASGKIVVNGQIHANGNADGCTEGGSGGGIRLIADQILGNGTISAAGIYLGRTRLEANSVSSALLVNPPTIAAAPSPLIIFPDYTSAPVVKVVSVAGLSAPADPLAKMSAAGDDLTLATTNTVSILLQTSNFPTNGTVNVYIKPRNSAQSILPASFVSGNTNQATWQLTTLLPTSHTVIQARAVY